MATSILSTTNLNFTSNGSATNAKVTATANTLTLEGTSSSTCILAGLATPTAANHAATKSYVDNATEGLDWKDAVVCSTTGNIDLTADLQNGDAIDGVTLVTGERVLVKDQTTGAQNGIYIVVSSGSAAASRADDMAAASAAASAAMFIKEGTVNGDTAWVCTNNDAADVVGTNALVFVQFSGGQSPGGSDTQLQYNNSGSLGGMSTVTTNGTNLTMSGGNITLADSDNLLFGAGSDLDIEHNGTNSLVTSKTGDLIVDNTATTGSTINRLGTDTTATDFQVQNNSASALFTVQGSGAASFSAAVTATSFGTGVATLSGGDLTGISTPTDAETGYAANVAYVLSKTNTPVNFTSQAKVTMFSNVTISGPGATLDTISMSVDDVVLLQGQTTATDDGMYLWKGAALTMPRTAAEAAGTTALNDVTYVECGTKAGYSYIQRNTANYGADLDYAVFSGATPAGGVDNNLQINNNGTFGGATNYNIASGAATSLIVSDSADIAFGTGSDFTISHDGTNTTATSATGDLIVDNTNATGSSIFRCGTDSSATDFQVQNNSASALFTVNAAGQADFSGNVDCTGGVDIDADSVALTIGAGGDLSISHDGTNTTATSTTGDFVVDNTNATGSSIFRCGTDTHATDFQVQNNSASALFTVNAAGQADFSGNVACTGGVDIDADSVALTIGAGGDLSISHDGTNTTATSTTGDFVVDNTNATGSSIFRCGTDSSATDFQVQNNSASALFTVNAAGQADFSGNVDCTGGVDIDADNVALTIGAGGDLSISHNGTNTTATSATGDFIVDNTATTGSTINRLGTDTIATDFQVQNNSATAVLTAYGTGEVVVSDALTVQGGMIKTTTVTTDATAGARTYTAAEMLGGYIARDPAGASRSDVTATAALIVAAVQDAEVGSSFTFFVNNTADAAETITLTAGTGVTLSGTMTIAQNDGRSFLVVMTNVTGSSEAVTVYDMGSLDADVTPGGSDTQMQFNNSGDLGGLSTFTTNGTNVSLSGGNLTLADNDNIQVGTGGDLDISHDGTNSLVTSATGDLIVDNTNATGSSIFRCGTDTLATDFQVQNNSASALFTVNAAGQADFSGNVDCTGGVDIDADSVALTIGAGGDLSISHDGTNTTATSTTGDFVVDNTNATGSSIFRCGTDSSATDFQVQNNSASALFTVNAAGQADFSGNVDCTGGVDIDADNVALTIGAGGDLSISHNGTNTTATSATGDFIVDNTSATGSSIMRLGADTAAVDFQVQNNSATAVLTAYGTGDVVVSDALTVQGSMIKTTTVTTDATAGARTYTAAEMLGGYIARDPAGASRSDVTATAALIVAAVQDAEVGSSFTFFINNTADAAETITLTAGTGVTLSGTMTIAQNDGRSFLVVMTNVTGSSEAVTVYDIGSLDADVTPGGSDTQMQFNNSGDLGGLSTFTTNGTNVSLSGGNLTLADNDNIQIGTGGDLDISHNGTNSLITSTTGDLTIDNTNATGSTIVQLGTDSSATDFQVQNNTGTAQLTIDGSGVMDVTGVTNFNNVTQSTSATSGAVIIDGGVGIAKDVFCAGDITAVAFNATSDALLKQDIQDIQNPLALLDSIDAVQYRFNFIENDHLRYGVLAQDLQANGLGHMVSENNSGLAVDYNNLVGLLIGAVKDLKHEVDVLKSSPSF